MKTIGLIGGMSWESSLEYYRIINETVREKLGTSHSAECLMYSVDFQEIEELQHAGNWRHLTDLMVEIAMKLKLAGADFIVICTNTMHVMAPDIEKRADIEVLHIADATGRAITGRGLERVALLGTKFTMCGDFYKALLEDKYHIDVMIPDEGDREVIHKIIYNELVRGIIKDDSREKYKSIIADLIKRGAQGVILGCTEIPLLIKQNDVEVPVFDTTFIHATAAVQRSFDLYYSKL